MLDCWLFERPRDKRPDVWRITRIRRTQKAVDISFSNSSCWSTLKRYRNNVEVHTLAEFLKRGWKQVTGSCNFGLVAPLGSIVCFVCAFDSDRMFLFGNWIHEDNEVRNDNDYEDNEVHNDTAFVGINSTSSSCCITACVIESNNRIHRNSARCASGASSSVSTVFESSIHGWQKQL